MKQASVNTWRNKFKMLLIDSGDFNERQFIYEGGFLGKRFWQGNLLWAGDGKSMSANFQNTLAFIC